MKNSRVRLETLNIEEVIPYIVMESPLNANGHKIQNNKIRKEFKGYSVKMASLRLQTFREKGITCCKCYKEASFFAIESIAGQQPNLELYGVDKSGDDLLFTKDHIIPKSKGGKDYIENMDTMCTKCNLEKGNDL